MLAKVDDLVDELLLLAREPADRSFAAERLVGEFLRGFIFDRNAVRAVLCQVDEALDRAIANYPEHEAFLTAIKLHAGARHPEPEQIGADGSVGPSPSVLRRAMFLAGARSPKR